MKVSDLVGDLEKGDRTMEHLVQKPEVSVSDFGEFPGQFRSWLQNSRDRNFINQLNSMQNPNPHQMFASSQALQGFGNFGPGGNIRW